MRRTTTRCGCSSRSSTRSSGHGRTSPRSPPRPQVLARPQRPLIIAGGGVHYSLAEETLASFAERHGIPVVETVAGKSTLTHDHPCYAGPIGVIGCEAANRLAAEADVVVAVGTRLQDFTTGSWSVFRNPACASSASTPPASTPASTGRCRSSATPGRRSSSSTPRSATGARRRGGRRGSPPRWPSCGTYLDRLAEPRRRAADVRPGRRAPSAPGDRARLRPHRVGRLPRRAQQRLAIHGVRDVRLRVRLLVHGLRAERWMGRGDGSRRSWRPTATRRVRRRRLVPDDQQRPLLVGAVRAHDDRRGVRQRRLRRDRPAAGQPGRRAVQQPARRRARARRAVRVDFAAHAASMGCEARRSRRSPSWARRSTGRGRPTARR